MSMIRLRQLGQNLLVSGNGSVETIVFPKSYNFEKLFALAFKWNQDSNQTALSLFNRELNKYRKVKEKNPEIVNQRIERKKVQKEIKKIQSINIEELPIVLTSEWREVLASQEDTKHIENFLIWLSLNDKKEVRDNFLSQFSSKFPYITPNGLLVSVRECWKHISEKADPLYTFIKSSYHRIKGQKKGVKNYVVIQIDGQYKLDKSDTLVPNFGNLAELYEKYPKPEEEVTYYSNYAKNNFDYREDWKLGEVVTVGEKATHTNWCDSGQLHIRMNPNDNLYGEYGDTCVIVLVNPKDITNVAYDWKYCTSRMQIIAEIDRSELSESFIKDFGKFDIDFIEYDMKSIKQEATEKTKSANKAVKKEKLLELKQSISYLKKPLQNDASHLSSDLYNTILTNRVQLINK